MQWHLVLMRIVIYLLRAMGKVQSSATERMIGSQRENLSHTRFHYFFIRHRLLLSLCTS